MPGYCIACDKKLRGRQRLYCSESCRKRYKRLSAMYPGLADNRPLSELFVRDNSAFDRETSVIAIKMLIKYQDRGRTHQTDGWAIKTKFAREMQKKALETLKELFYDWGFKIVNVEVMKK